MNKTKCDHTPQAAEKVRLGGLKGVIQLVASQNQAANEINNSSNCSDDQRWMNLDETWGTGDGSNSSDNCRWKSLNIVHAARLLHFAPLTVDNGLEQ